MLSFYYMKVDLKYMIKGVWHMRDNIKKRIGMSLFGVIICAVSVVIFKIAALGVDPFQSLIHGDGPRGFLNLLFH